MKNQVALNLDAVKIALWRLKALIHPLRLSIVQFIDTQGEVTMNKIYRQLQLDQSVIAQHLAILRKARLVYTRRDGMKIYYLVDYPSLKKLHGLANRLISFTQT